MPFLVRWSVFARTTYQQQRPLRVSFISSCCCRTKRCRVASHRIKRQPTARGQTTRTHHVSRGFDRRAMCARFSRSDVCVANRRKRQRERKKSGSRCGGKRRKGRKPAPHTHTRRERGKGLKTLIFPLPLLVRRTGCCCCCSCRYHHHHSICRLLLLLCPLVPQIQSLIIFYLRTTAINQALPCYPAVYYRAILFPVICTAL